MKKIIAILLLVIMCAGLVSCNNTANACNCSADTCPCLAANQNTEQLPKGVAKRIIFDNWPTRVDISAEQNNVQFEYVNANTVKIILESGKTIYVDTRCIAYIEV